MLGANFKTAFAKINKSLTKRADSKEIITSPDRMMFQLSDRAIYKKMTKICFGSKFSIDCVLKKLGKFSIKFFILKKGLKLVPAKNGGDRNC